MENFILLENKSWRGNKTKNDARNTKRLAGIVKQDLRGLRDQPRVPEDSQHQTK